MATKYPNQTLHSPKPKRRANNPKIRGNHPWKKEKDKKGMKQSETQNQLG